MSYQVRAARKEHFPWLVQRTGCALTNDFTAIEAMDADGHIRGMVGYANRTRNSVQLHMAVEAPIVWRSLLRPGLEYPFEHVGVLVGVIRSGNTRSLQFTQAVGFEEVFRLKDGHAEGEDLVFLQLRKEHCRYLTPGEAQWVAPEHRLRRVG